MPGGRAAGWYGAGVCRSSITFGSFRSGKDAFHNPASGHELGATGFFWQSAPSRARSVPYALCAACPYSRCRIASFAAGSSGSPIIARAQQCILASCSHGHRARQDLVAHRDSRLMPAIFLLLAGPHHFCGLSCPYSSRSVRPRSRVGCMRCAFVVFRGLYQLDFLKPAPAGCLPLVAHIWKKRWARYAIWASGWVAPVTGNLCAIRTSTALRKTHGTDQPCAERVPLRALFNRATALGSNRLRMMSLGYLPRMASAWPINQKMLGG